MKLKPLLYGGLALGAVALGIRSGYNQYNEEKVCSELHEPIDMYVCATNNHSLAELKKTSINPAAYRYTESFTKNEDLLKKTLNLTGETFSTGRDLAIGIAKEETHLGLEKGYLRKKNYTGIFSTAKWISGIFGTEEDRTLSRGFTNFKIGAVGKSEAEKLRKLGVKNIFDPAQSALATMVNISELNNAYNIYMKHLAPCHMEQFGTIIDPIEYVLARWKNLRLDTSEKSIVKDAAMENMKIIIADRTSETPKSYVWRILKQLDYVWDENGSNVIKRLHR